MRAAIPEAKATILSEAQEDVDRFTRAYHKGVISFGERYNKVIDAWTHANNDIAAAMVDNLSETHKGFNPVYMMFDSGSRGSLALERCDRNCFSVTTHRRTLVNEFNRYLVTSDRIPCG